MSIEFVAIVAGDDTITDTDESITSRVTCMKLPQSAYACGASFYFEVLAPAHLSPEAAEFKNKCDGSLSLLWIAYVLVYNKLRSNGGYWRIVHGSLRRTSNCCGDAPR